MICHLDRTHVLLHTCIRYRGFHLHIITINKISETYHNVTYPVWIFDAENVLFEHGAISKSTPEIVLPNILQ